MKLIANIIRMLLDELYIRKLCRGRNISRKYVKKISHSSAKHVLYINIVTRNKHWQHYIYAPFPKSGVRLLAVLHELGHCYCSHYLVEGKTGFDHEIEAWQWAINHYPYGIGIAETALINVCVSTYMDSYSTDNRLNIGGKEWEF